LSAFKNDNEHFALDCLRQGQPIAIPTETVYGLAASISNPLAIRRIFAIKERPSNHPLIIHITSLEMAEKYAFFSDLAREISTYFWPGPLTIILPKKDSVPFEVTGGLDTVGLRCPNHSLTRKLIQLHGHPLAAPSANRFGKISPTKASHVLDDYQGKVPVIDGGDCQLGLESTILDLSQKLPSIRRLGVITKKDLRPFISRFGDTETIAPGTMKAHYAPSTALHLSENLEQDKKFFEEKGLTVAILSIDDLGHYAKVLYAELRRLDQLGVDVLIAKKPPQNGLGLAITDRLNRASFGSRKD
jgi:L-threonylcarbamoyladenylate synthase